MTSMAVVYDLSDSDETPVIARKVSVSPSRRKPAAIAKALGGLCGSSRKCAEVVDLGSDSDDDVSSAAGSRGFSNGKNPRTKPSVSPPRGILGKRESPVGGYGMARSVFSYQIEATAGVVCKRRDYTLNPGDETKVIYHPGARESPQSAMPVSPIHSSKEAECPKLDPTPRNSLHSREQRPDEILGAPVHRIFEDLTGDSDDSEPEFLRDTVKCGSRKSGAMGESLSTDKWLRNTLPTCFNASDERSEGRVGNKRKGVDAGNFSFVLHDHKASFSVYDDHLETLAKLPKGKYARSNDGAPILNASETLQSTRLHDISNSEKSARVITSNKVSKGRKSPVSEFQLAAREAEKQRERDLKKARQDEEKRLREEKKEELRRQKETAKVEAAERRKLEKESVRWMKGKFALQNTTAFLDSAVLELKNLGALILRQIGEKSYNYKILSNPIKRSIVWKMKRPAAGSAADMEGLGSQLDNEMGSQVSCSQVSNSQLVLEDVEIKYVVIVFEAEEFSCMVAEQTLHTHVVGVQKEHPGYSVYYLVNGLMKYLNRKDQHHYKTGAGNWRRPNVELAIAELITHYKGVNLRLCIDESEIADHVVGLMRSLAECPFKQKLTSISVQANGEHVTKSDPNKAIIKKSIWLKALVAIPHISGAIAMAIAKVYPTMRALLNVYLDSSKTVLEKEFLLQDIVKDAALGAARLEGRRVGPIASKRIYRVFMAQDGNLMTADAEDGADHFTDMM